MLNKVHMYVELGGYIYCKCVHMAGNNYGVIYIYII